MLTFPTGHATPLARCCLPGIQPAQGPAIPRLTEPASGWFGWSIRTLAETSVLLGCKGTGNAAMLKSDEARTLRWIEGFSELSPSEIGQISSQCQWRWYEPHERIVSQEDTSNDVFFIVQGRVRITNYSTSGKEVSFRDLGVGEIFGELAAIDGSPDRQALSHFPTRFSRCCRQKFTGNCYKSIRPSPLAA
jgi:hypothetical protein